MNRVQIDEIFLFPTILHRKKDKTLKVMKSFHPTSARFSSCVRSTRAEALRLSAVHFALHRVRRNFEGSILGYISAKIPSSGVTRSQFDEISLFVYAKLLKTKS